MFSTVVDENTRPVHRQIRDQVLEEIARGRANEGDRLPSARSLASSLGVNF
jgi:DNA-binding transcriptional regulator YhcF (GntR family)